MVEVVRELRAGEIIGEFRSPFAVRGYPHNDELHRSKTLGIQGSQLYRDIFAEKKRHTFCLGHHIAHTIIHYLKGLSHDSVSLQYVSAFSCSHHCPCIINLVVLWDKIHYEKPGFQWGVMIEPLGSEHFARNTGFPRGLTTISPYVPCKKCIFGGV